MIIELCEPALVLLIGPSGAGKSTFARRHFRSTEVLSSDSCRALVCDNEADQEATHDAFELLHLILAKRLARRRTTIIDATNVQASARQPLLEAARKRNIPAEAIVFGLPEDVCQARNRSRGYRQAPIDVIRQQIAALQASMPVFADEGFASIHRLGSADDTDTITVVRRPSIHNVAPATD